MATEQTARFVYLSTPRTLENGQDVRPSLDVNGNIIVSGASGGTPIPTAAKQYATSTVPVIGTANATVMTLAAGEKGVIQNLDDAALAVRYGAACSTTVFTLILKGGTAASDGLGGTVVIDDWIGAVSVCAMTGTASYMANKLS